MKACRLCGDDRPLLDSHILPEFIYRPSYDHRRTAVLLDLRTGRKRKRQKGFTERLLCSVCEGKFSRWETYFANAWFNRAKSQRPPAISNGGLIQIPDLDYAQFKLFHLSLIWRAGVSRLSAFSNVRLGTQATKLRKRLLESDPGGPSEYPFFGIALRDPTTSGFQDRLVIEPEAARVGGHAVYTFLFGGVLWHYYISGRQSGRLVPVHFGLDGLLTLAVQDWTDNVFVRRFASKMGSK